MSPTQGTCTIPTSNIASSIQSLAYGEEDGSINFSNRRPGTSTSFDSLPPDYSNAVELSGMSPSSSSSHVSDEELPEYDGAGNNFAASSSNAIVVPTAPGFHPTRSFHIETAGHPLIALPFPPKPVPIPVYALSGTGQVEEMVYKSMRDVATHSNSCVLVRADDNSPACVTTYRFGPGRTPKLLLLPTQTPVSFPSTVVTSEDVAQALKAEPPSSVEPIQITSDGYHTRSQTMRTSLGTFRWRYATRTERREADADSLLVLEHITSVSLADGKKTEERRRRVAQLVRSDETRTEGSTKRTAGNGGRLDVDLGEWMREGRKGEGDEVERLVVASCLIMLKKEVDRRRLHQAIVLMAGS
ncbi:hypothetical protein LIA77_03051 [Sarocladium implicatum]|nr:hypothetical protein LIA77_03051 [Sarocladium implicatum]